VSHSRLAVLLLAVLVSPLAGQTNAERMLNDRYSRSHDYDLVRQRIELKNLNWDSLSFDGSVSTTLRALRPGFDSIVLDAGPRLAVKAVRVLRIGKAVSAAASFEHPGDTLVIHLARPAAFGDTVQFSISYTARIDNGHGLTFIEADTGAPRRPRQLWSQGEDDNNHDWFPTYDFPNDKATWEVVATVPKGFTAVSNGRLVQDRPNADGTRTLDWSQDQPSATYLVSLVVAPLVKVPDRWRAIPVDYYVYPQDQALARPLFRRTPDMIEVYSKLTGVPYPWTKYAQTTVADFFGGMENVSATTLVDWLPDARAYADRPWYAYELIAHELSHQWFGDYVTTANWANMWLNEGFATFMPGQYWRARQGDHAAQDYYLEQYDEALQIDSTRRMPLASLGSNNIYPKGALVLEMLRKYLGDERFWAGINRYLRDHAFGVAVTDDLRQAFLEATGENLDWFWNEWMYQAGLPRFSVSALWDSGGGTLSLTVKQTQSDTATADSTGLRYSVPAAFRMPVSIRVGTRTGDVVQRAWLETREQTITVEGVPTAPTMVVFDDGNMIDKTLEFPQPTGWLAAQLAHDPDLWNRKWVIDQLAPLTADSLAARALSAAVVGADYFLTRIHAAVALAGFPPAVAVPALAPALRDTSAQVRAAAVGALGNLGGDSALALVRDRFEHDTSYQVRATALGALVALDSANAATLLRQGLKTPSYQNVIQDVALAAIQHRGDTSFVEDVAAHLGDQENPAYVLGSFASRGSARALDLLAQHLNDPRAAIRTRVLDAFKETVRPEIALPRLQAERANVTSEQTRREMDALISALSR
jgi:aminopeptidase N